MGSDDFRILFVADSYNNKVKRLDPERIAPVHVGHLGGRVAAHLVVVHVEDAEPAVDGLQEPIDGRAATDHGLRDGRIHDGIVGEQGAGGHGITVQLSTLERFDHLFDDVRNGHGLVTSFRCSTADCGAP